MPLRLWASSASLPCSAQSLSQLRPAIPTPLSSDPLGRGICAHPSPPKACHEGKEFATNSFGKNSSFCRSDTPRTEGECELLQEIFFFLSMFTHNQPNSSSSILCCSQSSHRAPRAGHFKHCQITTGYLGESKSIEQLLLSPPLISVCQPLFPRHTFPETSVPGAM